jgi:hypothetical protein
LKPIESCLGHGEMAASLKRAILEVSIFRWLYKFASVSGFFITVHEFLFWSFLMLGESHSYHYVACI